MLGVALLVLSLLLYFSKKGRLMSYFLYVGFLLDGYGILIDPLLGGTKNGDLALVYTVLISILMVLIDITCLSMPRLVGLVYFLLF